MRFSTTASTTEVYIYPDGYFIKEALWRLHQIVPILNERAEAWCLEYYKEKEDK